MTISSNDRIAQYTGNGTSTFSFQFKVFQASDLLVVKQDAITGIETTLTLTTDYTVTLNADQNYNPGGNVITTSAVAVNYNLTITSNIENLQPTDLSNQGGFYPDVINNSLDRATIQIQQLADASARSMIAPISDGQSNNLELPSATARANKYLAFDANGLPVASSGNNFADITSAGNITITANNGGGNTARDVIFYDNATETMRVKGSGTTSRVGIGTATPATTLDIAGQTRLRAGATYAEPTDNAAVLAYDATGGILTVDARSNAGTTNIAFRASTSGTGGERVRIRPTGNVLEANGIVSSNRTTAGTFVVSGDGAYTFGTDTKQYIYGKPGNDGNVAIYTTTAAGATNDRLNVTSTAVQVKTALTTTTTATIGDTLTVTTGGVTVSAGQVLVPPGTAAAPSFSISGDTTTGIYQSAAQEIGISTNGVNRLKIGNTGVGIGSTPVSRLHVHETAAATATDIRLTSAVTGATVSDGVALRLDASGVSSLWNYENTGMLFATNNTEKMRIEAGGNVGIGTTSPQSNARLDVSGGTIRVRSATYTPGTDTAGILGQTSAGLFTISSRHTASSEIQCRVTDSAGTDTLKLRLTENGLGVNTFPPTCQFEVTETTVNLAGRFNHTNASPAGIAVIYTNTPNGTSNSFLRCADTGNTTLRAEIRSNGGISNYTANNVALSDERVKTDIAPLESQWNTIKQIEIVEFKYRDQTHTDRNIGVIAQQVETVNPVWVETEGWEATIDGESTSLKSVYDEDVKYAAIKALQEAMLRIEQLEARIAALEATP